jgi:hypothetical protein
MMFEADLVEQLLRPLKKHPGVRGDGALLAAIDTMIDEEIQHFALFAALNRACCPDIYPAGVDRVFSVVPFWGKAMFWSAAALAGQLSFALWYLMAMEESSLSFARDLMRRRDTETLGPLDEAFSAVHIEHMKDETRHIHVDAHLIRRTIGEASRLKRLLNAGLFQAMLRRALQPTRGGSGIKVIRQLVRDMPELQSQEARMISEVLALKDNVDFQSSLFNRQVMPKSFEIFDETVELARLAAKAGQP